MDALGNLRVLEHLDLSFSDISDAGLQKLGALKSLKSLSLMWMRNISGSSLVHLRALPRLESLRMDGCTLGPVGLKETSALTGLKFLSVCETDIGDANLEELPSGIEEIYMLDTRVSAAGFRSLGRLRNLRVVLFSGTAITSSCLDTLCDLPCLEEISFPRIRSDTDAARLESFVRERPDVTFHY